MYEYNCKLLRVVDGDTVDVLIDLGFSTYQKHRVRLLNIDAPENRTRDLEEKKRGIASAKFLEGTLEERKLKIRTKLDKRGKYGRTLGTLFTVGSTININVNLLMVEMGHAVEKNYA